MTNDKATLDSIRKARLPVIIFGAGVVGEAMLHACRKAGIVVECFCDNNVHKTKAFLCNTEVIYAPQLEERYPDAQIMISAADIKDVVSQLNELGYHRWYSSSPLLRGFDLHPYQFSAPLDFVEYAVATCLLCHDSYMTPGKIFMRSVDIVITERCSLRCRDCSNLMQYYKKPVDENTEELLQSIKVFTSLIDEVNEFRVIGGEPFMNKEFHLIVKRLVHDSKVKRVVIYTNGTIVPRKEQMEHLKDKKVLVLVTDYGALSPRKEELTRVLQENRIAYYAHKAGGWTDCGRIVRRGRTVEEQKRVFKGCCAKNTLSLSKGRLYRCPFSANADRLRAVPDHRDDYIHILPDPKNRTFTVEMRKAICEFISKKEYLETCDYCSGRPFEAREITPAVQANSPMEFIMYGSPEPVA